mmetsp:Transcript_57706/g.133261  ORF Transcript_57706/g.133261 Transcript_57706/m.133261 type:complete len:397 (+) Transcript_57706:5335-6525(+)
MADHMNAEVVVKTIENKQDAVDWLTWTFYYRRLSQNPNYYGLKGVGPNHISDHLSETVETTVDALEAAGCLSVDDVDLGAANLGVIAAFYYSRYTTVELYNRSIKPTTKRKGILDVLSAVSEYDSVPVRHGEEAALRGLAQSLGVRVGDANVNEPHAKALILLNAHMQRTPISTDLASDLKYTVEQAPRLLQAMVDVIASMGTLKPALVAMELSQMLVQATQADSSPLLQLPHFSEQLISAAKKAGVEDIFDLINMDDPARDKLFSGLSQQQVQDIAKACNRYPAITVEFKVAKQGADMAKLQVKLEREGMEEGDKVGPVSAPYFPNEKEESWWLVVGNSEGQLVGIKRTTIAKQVVNVKMDVELGEQPGKQDFRLFLMSDSYQGCDQEYQFAIDV